MKDFKILFFSLVCFSTNLLWAIEVPQEVEAAFRKACPEIDEVAWSANDGYYVATFTKDAYETQLWFDAQGHWVMQQTDWGNLSEAPSSVFNAFAASPYSSNEVHDVVALQYPAREWLVALVVAMPNESNGYLLLYNEQGELTASDAVYDVDHCLRASTLLQAADD